MSVQYFYNFILKNVDRTELEGDLLSGVRKSFLRSQVRIRDKITGNSASEPLFYDFSIEKEKPMKWVVKNASGATVQEVRQSDSGKYYIYYYVDQALYKRLLFSKHHTLLKTEYFDALSGAVRHTLEPRKAQNSLCILYTVKTSARPIALFEEPGAADPEVSRRLKTEFDDYTVVASTDEGIVRFLSEEQLAKYNSLKEQFRQEAEQNAEVSYVGSDTPLLDKIKANDFNVKRNLSTALDITLAMEFGVHDDAEESPAATPYIDTSKEDYLPYEDDTILIDGYASAVSDEIVSDDAEVSDETITEVQEELLAPKESVPVEPVPIPAAPAIAPPISELYPQSSNEPDKRIMADGEIYSYYGELDANGNRSGYGRTMTEQGRTAYEGVYYNDKRSGVGSYFYKDGSLCYTGDWLENVRHGVGVGVSSRDGSIHVGNWKNNKPDGNGVRLTADGDIKFVCKELFDGTTVLMHYMPDDSVIISKYDQYGTKLGDKTISLKDLTF